MRYQLRWWGTKKVVNKEGEGYSQYKNSQAGEKDFETHEDARQAAFDWLCELEEFDLVEIKVMKLPPQEIR